MLIFLFGVNGILNYFNIEQSFEFKLPHNIWQISKEYMNKFSFIASFLSGFIIGVFEFPCTGGIYLSIIGMLSYNITYKKGFYSLLLYILSFITPLFLILIITIKIGTFNLSIMRWNKKYKSRIKLISSIMALVIGVLLLWQ